ncbi:hypothetical protein RJ640_021341 [Escallonia rubra]|uniref:Uncharacterized protein n=1 Tax=Escallonia rubra TaxID=112253 RepID=A0AA88RHN5_9ASTE|nr:hypothetical protein RJ640_021341 [Escallonia rubra]
MGRTFGGRSAWFRLSNTFRLVKSRPFCTPNDNNSSKPTIATSPNNTNGDKVDGSLTHYDAYRDVDKLDFMTAAKILFTTPPKTKKFGIDFHLVQLFFACMPSLGISTPIVTKFPFQELELKKKAEEAEKAKEVELKAVEEKEAGSSPEILDVKVRLDKLEEVVKEYVVESKKQSGITSKENQERSNEKKQPTVTAPSDTLNRSESSISAAGEHPDKQITSERTRSSSQQKSSGSALVADASQKDPEATQDGEPSRR